MFLGVPPAGDLPLAEPDVEHDVEPDALLQALTARNLPEVTATSGEVAAVYATEDATPAARHLTPVPEPAVIAPDPRHEPTHRIPREWVGALDAMAKEAMGARTTNAAEAPRMSNARWVLVGVLGSVMVIAALWVAQRSTEEQVNKVDIVQPAASVHASPATTQPTASTPLQLGTPPPRAIRARTKQATPSSAEDPDYKLLK